MDENTILFEMSPGMGRRFADVQSWRGGESREDVIGAILDKGIDYFVRLKEAEAQRKQDAKARHDREDFERYLTRNPKEAQECAADNVKLLNLLARFGILNASLLNSAAANAKQTKAA